MIYRIDKTTIEDLIALKSVNLMNTLISTLEEYINNGGTITVERRYVNAEPDLIMHITTIQELVQEAQNWIDSLNEMIQHDRN